MRNHVLENHVRISQKNLSSQRELNFAEVRRYSMKMKIWIVVLNCNFKSYVSGSADWSWQSLSPDASAEIFFIHYRRERPRFSNYFLFKAFVIFGLKFYGKKTDENLHYCDTHFKIFLVLFPAIEKWFNKANFIAWGCLRFKSICNDFRSTFFGNCVWNFRFISYWPNWLA